jgi:hypothetical protein
MLPDALQGIVEKPEKFVAHPVTNLQPALHPAPLAQTGHGSQAPDVRGARL